MICCIRRQGNGDYELSTTALSSQSSDGLLKAYGRSEYYGPAKLNRVIGNLGVKENRKAYCARLFLNEPYFYSIYDQKRDYKFVRKYIVVDVLHCAFVGIKNDFLERLGLSGVSFGNDQGGVNRNISSGPVI